MKKVLCLLIVVIILLGFVGCDKKSTVLFDFPISGFNEAIIEKYGTDEDQINKILKKTEMYVDENAPRKFSLEKKYQWLNSELDWSYQFTGSYYGEYEHRSYYYNNDNEGFKLMCSVEKNEILFYQHTLHRNFIEEIYSGSNENNNLSENQCE